MTVRAQLTAVIVVLALVGLADFAKRVYVPRSPSDRTADLELATGPARGLSLAEARQRLESWLPDDTAAVSASAEAGAGDVGDRTDRGRLGGQLFVLRGIFNTESGPPFAVFAVTDDGGSVPERFDAVEGDTIRNVQVDRISGRRVYLTTGNEELVLSLFLDSASKTVATDDGE